MCDVRRDTYRGPDSSWPRRYRVCGARACECEHVRRVLQPAMMALTCGDTLRPIHELVKLILTSR
eukprot:scaffold1945_cov395-Prasinococcus_capsulatus_cf.AAC.5